MNQIIAPNTDNSSYAIFMGIIGVLVIISLVGGGAYCCLAARKRDAKRNASIKQQEIGLNSYTDAEDVTRVAV